MNETYCAIPAKAPGSLELPLSLALSRLADLKIIVLDDDSTGTQTVHGVNAYTGYDKASINEGFSSNERIFYLLTDSRGFSANKTRREHLRLTQDIVNAARAAGKDFMIVSRGDSTLRGHFPLETDTIAEVLDQNGLPVDGVIFVPFLPEGGRVTIDNVHYVLTHNKYIPAGETEFAKDPTFGYENSNLKRWVEEKTQGRIPRGDVEAITLEELRGNLDDAQRKLLNAQNGQIIIVNAVEYTDLEAFVIALTSAIAKGKRFLFRSAAALPRVLAGISEQDYLSADQLCERHSMHGGLVAIGSHTAKTNQQLKQLLMLDNTEAVEFNSDLALDPQKMVNEIKRASAKAGQAIFAGRTAVLYTKRDPLVPEDMSSEEKLALSVNIAGAFTEVVRRISVRPAFVIVKGGMTAAKIVQKALGAKRARVLGQASAGVPVWQLGGESRYPNLPYIIFPGNLGKSGDLKDLVEKLHACKQEAFAEKEKKQREKKQAERMAAARRAGQYVPDES